ncbi:hypothetical protein OSTOST_09210 [Ostertagia ostertagi]
MNDLLLHCSSDAGAVKRHHRYGHVRLRPSDRCRHLISGWEKPVHATLSSTTTLAVTTIHISAASISKRGPCFFVAPRVAPLRSRGEISKKDYGGLCNDLHWSSGGNTLLLWPTSSTTTGNPVKN